MTRMSRVGWVAAVLIAGPQVVGAQVLDTRLRTTTTSPTTDQLLERIVALEARLARLEGLLSVVNGTVVLDGRGAPVVLKGGSVLIQPDRDLEVRAGGAVRVEGLGSLSLRAMGTLAVDASAGLSLKGSTIMLNNGAKPVACMGAMTSAGEGLRSHIHQLTGQGCGATVLVP